MVARIYVKMLCIPYMPFKIFNTHLCCDAFQLLFLLLLLLLLLLSLLQHMCRSIHCFCTRLFQISKICLIGYFV